MERNISLKFKQLLSVIKGYIVRQVQRQSAYKFEYQILRTKPQGTTKWRLSWIEMNAEDLDHHLYLKNNIVFKIHGTFICLFIVLLWTKLLSIYCIASESIMLMISKLSEGTKIGQADQGRLWPYNRRLPYKWK